MFGLNLSDQTLLAREMVSVLTCTVYVTWYLKLGMSYHRREMTRYNL